MPQMMSQTEIETIVAPITAPGQAAVSVVRLSGANVEAILAKLCPKSEEILKHPRQVTFAEIIDHLNKNSSTPQTLDQALVTYFQHPASFTGEDICEFQLHGSPFLVERLVANCLHFGARMAEPGEFSKRAFLNGKLDLSQAEAVADLIAAETEGQARVAAEQLQGKLSQAMYLLGEPLRDLLAEIEAQIDFPEEDVGAENLRSWVSRIGKTQEEITRYLASFSTGRLYRDGATVSLVGLPNAGKSSLLNRLVGEERAIVTPIPGTTRDSIEERIAISGIYIRLWDTAGLIAEDVPDRQSDEVEILGIERSWKRLELSDLVLFVIDGTSDFSIEKQVFEKVRERVKELIVVINKIDLFPGHEAQPARQVSEELRTEDPVSLSALTAYGVQNLREKIGNKLLGNTSLGTSRVLITNQRHFEALKKSESFLGNALHALTQNTPLELIALDLRAALGALDDIIGITYNDDILGRIFSKFCIGK